MQSIIHSNYNRNLKMNRNYDIYLCYGASVYSTKCKLFKSFIEANKYYVTQIRPSIIRYNDTIIVGSINIIKPDIRYCRIIPIYSLIPDILRKYIITGKLTHFNNLSNYLSNYLSIYNGIQISEKYE